MLLRFVKDAVASLRGAFSGCHCQVEINDAIAQLVDTKLWDLCMWMPATKSRLFIAPVSVSLKDDPPCFIAPPPCFNSCFSPHSVSVLDVDTGSCCAVFLSHEWIEAKRVQLKALRASGEIVHGKIHDLPIPSHATD